MFIIGIDASNIKAGGGLTHLSELILNYQPIQDRHLILFASQSVLNTIPDFDFLTKINDSWLNKGSFYNMLWRLLLLRRLARKKKVNIMFTPGGNFLSFSPYVSMSQNMLVFESKERNRFPSLMDRLRYHILEFKQLLSFRFSSGVIFISEYARNYIQSKYPFLHRKKSEVVYHGVAERFSYKNEIIKTTSFSDERPFRLLYVSIINYYKHQDKLIEAVTKLKKSGIPIELNLIGPLNPKIKTYFENLLMQSSECVKYHGKVPYEKIHSYYSNCDLFVFASTCENMPNILVEAMKASVPILCSSYGPMPEILKDGGIYFDPINIKDICEKIMLYKNSNELRKTSANTAMILAKNYAWPKCANQTFKFINECLKEYYD